MNFEVVFQLFLAVLLGGVIGLEREVKRKGAGLQTYSLVCLGACLFTIMGIGLLDSLIEEKGIIIDPLRLVQAVAIGIGFIGAGTIIQRGSFVEGLTTAAGLWVVSAIGVVIGARFYLVAILSAFLSLVILVGFGFLEGKFFSSEE